MMNMLINLGVKFSGLGWVWEKADGYKTKAAAVMGLIDGIAHLLLALCGFLNMLSPALTAHNAGALVAIARHLGTDPNWQALLSAWRSCYAGLGVLGIGHKIDKANTVPQVQAPASK